MAGQPVSDTETPSAAGVATPPQRDPPSSMAAPGRCSGRPLLWFWPIFAVLWLLIVAGLVAVNIFTVRP
jgi:hypothetical protein